MNEDTTRLLKAVYESTFRTVRTALPSPPAPPEALEIAAAALRHVEGTVDGFRQLAGAATVCRAGCSYCCWMRIDVLAHEVLLIARHARQHASPEELSALQERAEAQRALAAVLSFEENQRQQRPCVLLKDGCCSVYTARPSACRRYFSLSLEDCELLWRDSHAEASPQHPLVAEAGRYAAGGVRNALVHAGFDAYSYDLPSALVEALADPECEQRWLRGEKAFSRAAESKFPPGTSQEEALTKLKASLARSCVI